MSQNSWLLNNAPSISYHAMHDFRVQRNFLAKESLTHTACNCFSYSLHVNLSLKRKKPHSSLPFNQNQ